MKKINLILLFFFTSLTYFYAQDNIPYEQWNKSNRIAFVKQALTELNTKKSTLIVRLPSNHKKITELKRLSKSKDLSPQKVQNMKELLIKTSNLTPAFNMRLMSTFHEEYDFSDVLFIYDTASVSLKNGVKSGYFLNKFAKIDKNIKLISDNWVLLSLDYDGYPNAMNLNDFNSLDKNLKELPKPFPQDARTNLASSMRLLFMKNSQEKQRFAMEEMVKKYNKRLYKAYGKLN